nr:hypothetical protein [Tanacetum cinerariifolium]
SFAWEWCGGSGVDWSGGERWERVLAGKKVTGTTVLSILNGKDTGLC